jgi:hypothetical protein
VKATPTLGSASRLLRLGHRVRDLSKGGSGIFCKGKKSSGAAAKSGAFDNSRPQRQGKVQAGTKEQALQPNQGTARRKGRK